MSYYYSLWPRGYAPARARSDGGKSFPREGLQIEPPAHIGFRLCSRYHTRFAASMRTPRYTVYMYIADQQKIDPTRTYAELEEHFKRNESSIKAERKAAHRAVADLDS